MRLPLLTCSIVLVLGCKSDIERCQEAQAAAAEAWGAYANALEADLKTARAEQTASQTKLTALHETLSDQAERTADARHARSDSAWLRTFEIARTSACSNDEDCLATRRSNDEAKSRADSLLPRLTAARDAEKAARGEPTAARTAAEAMEMDYEYAQMKAARAASTAADAQCQGVTLPAEE